MQGWSLTSWQNKPYNQQVIYPEQAKVDAVVNNLAKSPPLVTPMEVDALKKQLAHAARGESFLLQGGDCAERFDECDPDTITNKLKILLQMSLVLTYGLRKPVIRVGRIAGQYAKPRSAKMETRDGTVLPNYRGDLINAPDFTESARSPDPDRMKQGYHYSALTLNYIRALVDSGFADYQHPENWNLDFMQHSPLAKEYLNLVDSLTNAFNLTKAFTEISKGDSIDFYTSHEAIHLYYEQALSRQRSDGNWYDLSTHFPWIGMRTANIDGAHVEFFRGMQNPIAVKIGPNMTPEWIEELVNKLNPNNQEGRLALVMRLGVKTIDHLLPKLIEAVNSTEKNVLWCCDPMHGNTQLTSSGIKTRHFEDILTELRQTFHIHKSMGTHFGGVHFELTGDNVTECIGGARGLSETDLHQAYESLIDPRLNYEQALEMALLIAHQFD